MFFAVVILWFFVEKGSPLCLWSELGATEGGSLVKTTPFLTSVLLYAMLIKKQGMFAVATKKKPLSTKPRYVVGRPVAQNDSTFIGEILVGALFF